MRKRILFGIAGFFFFVSMLFAQDVPVGVLTAFKNGSSQELNTYLGDKIELIIQNKSSTINKRMTEESLANFFAANKVSGFNVNHEGKRDESSFFIGTLVTANGSFRVNCFFKKIQNKYVIHQIRIDKTNE